MIDRLVRRQVAGIELSIVEPLAATQNSQTLFCMHGIGGDDQSFLPQSIGLSNQHRIIAWNMPGYQNSRPQDGLTFPLLSNTLKQVLDELAIKQPILVGHSIGGMIAQEFAHQYPGVAKSLILIATTAAFGGGDDSFKEGFLAARLKPLDAGISMAAMSAEAIPAIVGRNTEPAVIQAAIESMSALNPAVYREVLKCLVTFNRRTELPNLTGPMCLIAGEHDTNAPAKTMQKMSDQLTNAEYHVIAEAGHLVNLERGDETNGIMAQFIERRISL